ncbi:unnamed protein product [Nezara viridula]|uniref:Putative nuclease HARBI1 n=1 Tax=Nezara viridula TaxID=85310 RepID=A0A9P0H585_NEZVI|nr:unnamed protein product [Nezara viridula]
MDLIDFDDLTDDEDFLDLIALFLKEKKVFRPRVTHFLRWSDEEFFDRFRLSKETVQFILNLIKPAISNLTNRNHGVNAELMLLTTLRYYATGSFLNVCGDFSGLHKSTVSRIINKVSRAIASLKNNYIYMVKDEDEERRVKRRMFGISGFPNCIGAINCTHIRLQSSGGDQSQIFRNRRGFFSLNVQTISDADLKIRNIVVRWPGSTDDATIFHNSNIKTRFESGEFRRSVLVGDEGYILKNYLLTPLKNPKIECEYEFNECLIQTWKVAGRCYRVWKRRFPVLAKGLRIKLSSVEAIVVATAVLHNIACNMNEKVPEVDANTALKIEQQQFHYDIAEYSENKTAREPFISYFQRALDTI